MYLRKIYIQNYRLLNNVNIDFDSSLTLFVGKNNTGKTSVMKLIQFILSDEKYLKFDDYPLDARQILYSAIKYYWSTEGDDNRIDVFRSKIPLTQITLEVAYTEEDNLGALSEFIIDLDENMDYAIIRLTFAITPYIEEVLQNCKQRYESLVNPDMPSNKKQDCLAHVIQNSFSSIFNLRIETVNPTNQDDTLERDRSHLKKLFLLKSISAERNLGETEENYDKNPLGQIMKQLFTTELGELEQSVQPVLDDLKRIITETNFSVQSDINEHLNKIVTTMAPFGYPSAEDMKLNAKTNVALQKRIENETELTYISQQGNDSLPGSHNGLGYKNLIKISMELHNFAREVKKDLTKIPLLFLEEPEAHMHPQLQTNFIKYLSEFLTRVVGANIVQVLVTTHSAHIANTVDFKQVRYMRRHLNCVSCKSMHSFPEGGVNETEKEDRRDFMQKYMKLSLCDLYFCDKAILVEGASERLLLPDMIEKCDKLIPADNLALKSQYCTIIEVGGAYAHKFFEFVDYLEIPTLIITDIDFVDENGKACDDKAYAVRTSNATILRWCHDVYKISVSKPVSLDVVINLLQDDEKRVNGLRRITYQLEENGCHPRSLEDAIINVNRELFGKKPTDCLDFNKTDEKKTDFALRLLLDSRFTNYKVPSYIVEGLVWLRKQSRIQDGEEPTRQHKLR